MNAVALTFTIICEMQGAERSRAGVMAESRKSLLIMIGKEELSRYVFNMI